MHGHWRDKCNTVASNLFFVPTNQRASIEIFRKTKQDIAVRDSKKIYRTVWRTRERRNASKKFNRSRVGCHKSVQENLRYLFRYFVLFIVQLQFIATRNHPHNCHFVVHWAWCFYDVTNHLEPVLALRMNVKKQFRYYINTDIIYWSVRRLKRSNTVI